MVCQSLPRNSNGLCVYSEFSETLFDIRAYCLSNMILESYADDLDQYFLSISKQIDSSSVSDSRIPISPLLTAIMNSTRLTFSKHDIVYLLADCRISGNEIEFEECIPHIVNRIKSLFNYCTIVKSNSLWNAVGFTIEDLLFGVSSDFYQHRLTLMFQKHDVDRSGVIDEEEFISCMQDIDYSLKQNEMKLLWEIIHLSEYQNLSFHDIAEYITSYIIYVRKLNKVSQLVTYSDQHESPLYRYYSNLWQHQLQHQLDFKATLSLFKSLNFHSHLIDIAVSMIPYRDYDLMRTQEYQYVCIQHFVAFHDHEDLLTSSACDEMYSKAYDFVQSIYEDHISSLSLIVYHYVTEFNRTKHLYDNFAILADQLFDSWYLDLTQREFNYLAHAILDTPFEIELSIERIKEIFYHMKTLTTMSILLLNDRLKLFPQSVLEYSLNQALRSKESRLIGENSISIQSSLRILDQFKYFNLTSSEMNGVICSLQGLQTSYVHADQGVKIVADAFMSEIKNALSSSILELKVTVTAFTNTNVKQLIGELTVEMIEEALRNWLEKGMRQDYCKNIISSLIL